MSWLPSRRVLLLTVTALAASVLSTVPATVATAAPARPAPVLLPAPTVAPTSFAAGSSTTVSGAQCTPKQFTRVYVSLSSDAGRVVASTSVTPSADGTWKVVVTAPFSTTPGPYSVSATCDRYGSQAPYRPRPVTVTASSAAPWTTQAPALPDVPNGSLTDTDCIAAPAKTPIGGVAFCAAVGHVGKAGGAAPLVEVFDGSGWSVAAVTSPVAGDVYLSSVDCPSTTRCVAVGDIGTDSGHHAFVAIMAGTTWTASVLDPPTGETESSIDAVSCPSTTVCIATGSTGYLSEGSSFQPIAYQLKNTTWTQINSPVAQSTLTTLSAISCVNAVTCVAVGRDFRSYPATPVAEVFDGTFWHTSSLAPVATGSSPGLSDVSCATLSTCTAVGSYVDGNGVDQPLVETLTNTTWKQNPVAVDDPAVGGGLRSVSCTGNKDCTAVGAVGSPQGGSPELPVVATLANGRWSSAVVDVGAGASELAGVSCPQPGTCVAVGDAQNLPLAAVRTSTGWSRVDLATPHGYVGGRFDAVSCSSVNACTAGGWSYTSDDSHTTPLVNRWNGTSWSNQTLPDVGSARISGVACPVANRCVAVGRTDVDESRSQPLVLLWAAGTWRRVTVRLPRGATGVLTAVSCTSSTSCLAVGQSSPYSGDPLAVAIAGSTSTVTPTPPVGGLEGVTLGGVSCVAGAGCRVVGSGYDPTTFGSAGIDLVWDGTAFTPGPEVAASSAVSCTGPTTCVAVGGFSDEPTAAQVLDGSSWTGEPLPDPSGSSSNVDGVSCRGTLTCVAVGGLIARRTASGTWVPEPAPSGPGYLDLRGVACPSDTRCVAVGGRGSSPTIVVSPAG